MSSSGPSSACAPEVIVDLEANNQAAATSSAVTNTADPEEVVIQELLSLRDGRTDGTSTFESFVPLQYWKEGNWTSSGNSLYGLAMLMCLGADINVAGIVFPALFLLGGAQGVILVNLWKSTGYVNAAPSTFCLQDDNYLFFTAIIACFLVSLAPALQDVVKEIKIVTSANMLFAVNSAIDDDGEAHMIKLERAPANVVYCTLIVLYEALIWIAVLLIGIVYILTTSGEGNIVQSAVAISFINEIDNMIMWIGLNDLKVSSCKFRTTYRSHRGQRLVGVLMFGMPIILCVSVGIVYGLRDTYCNR